MKLAVHFPQTEIEKDPRAIRDFAVAVEQMGYDQLLFCDHVLGADPDRPGGWEGIYGKADTFHEPLVTMAHMAALTTKLAFMPAVLVLPQRQAVVVAKQAAEIDFLSNGRIELAVGVGWNEVEYEALAMPFRHRGRLIEEQIEVMRRLWTSDSVEFDGRWHRIDHAGLNPMPTRLIPVWLGGGVDALLRRAARLGDGWMPGGSCNTMEAAEAAVAKLRGYLAEEGRDPAGFGIHGGIPLLLGGPELWVEYAERWRALGATHLHAWTMNAGLEGADAHLEAARKFVEAVRR